MVKRIVLAMLVATAFIFQVEGQWEDLSSLPSLTRGRTAAQNALWIENPLSARFNASKRAVVADIKGPAVITMIHFAMPQTLTLNRDLLVKMYWDGEESPSVDCPFVDFFCDPAGTRDVVNSALVNKRRGFNAYFPMPFRKSARIELVYDGALEPGDELWRIMPAYSYVMCRTMEQIDDNEGYFHAHWRQDALLVGKEDYVALEAKGKGKFVGWNVTVRLPARAGYPVDENEKFYIDGEEAPSVEFQGLEDSFGFSWGFPPTENMFPLTGFFPFFKGAAAYRFFINDAISFEKSLRVTIGFGENEHPMFRSEFSKVGNELQFSSVVYWYQTEPHAALPPVPAPEERAPAPEDPFWLHKEEVPSAEQLRERGTRLYMLCGRPEKEVIFAEPGYAAEVKNGYAYDGWSLPVYHCRASEEDVQVELTVPPNSAGTVRLFMTDPDNFQGGRKQEVWVGGESLGVIENFQEGRWLEHRVSEKETAEGKVLIRAKNAREGSNAVTSIIEWVQAE
jgi:hypothetical protein